MNTVWVHHGDQTAYEAVTGFVSSRIWGKVKAMPAGTAMAVVDAGKMIAGVVFAGYDDDNGTIEISAASDSPRWLTRARLFDMYDYAFNQMGCQAVIQRNDPDNARLARMLTSYGFDRHDIPRLRGRDKGEAIFVLADDVWRANGFHKENE